jgi:hypothetical protein
MNRITIYYAEQCRHSAELRRKIRGMPIDQMVDWIDVHTHPPHSFVARGTPTIICGGQVHLGTLNYSWLRNAISEWNRGIRNRIDCVLCLSKDPTSHLSQLPLHLLRDVLSMLRTDFQEI